MSNRTADGRLDQRLNGEAKLTLKNTEYTGQIYKGELLMALDSGLIDQAAPGQLEGTFEGISNANALSTNTPAEDLDVLRRGVFKGGSFSSDATADAAEALRILDGGSNPTLSLASHRGRWLYAVDSRTLDMDPVDPSAPLAGRILRVTTAGGAGTGLCRVLLDADWAEAARLMSPLRQDPLALNQFDMVECFEKRPTLSTDITPATPADPSTAELQLRFRANPNFEVSGTNMTSALATHHADGGVTLTTAGASADQAILAPRSFPTSGTFWKTGLNTAKRPFWETRILTDASVAALRIHAKLAITAVLDTATDNDQIGLMFDTGLSHTNWTIMQSLAGTDTTSDTGVAVAADTEYRIRIVYDENRLARVYINGVLVYTSAALTSVATMIPVVGVHALAAAAKAITCRFMRKRQFAAA